MAKFRVYVSTNKIGSLCEKVVEIGDDEVPDNWQQDGEFYDGFLDDMHSMIDWGIERID